MRAGSLSSPIKTICTLAWRLRVQLLSPKKEWEIGPGLRVGVAHLDSLLDPVTKQKMFNGKDLDPHNKQHWAGVLKMFTEKTSNELKRRIDNGEFHLKATYSHCSLHCLPQLMAARPR